MNDENIKNLKNLAKVSHRSGILPIFLGILVMFIGAINSDYFTISVGLLIFILGYSFLKIGQKINKNIG